MLAILVVFAVLSFAVVPLARFLGSRVFYLAALLPIAGFVHALMQAPAVVAGPVPHEAYEWIRPLDVEISMRMDALSWALTLVVTGVGAIVLIYCATYFRGQGAGRGRFAGELLGFAGTMYGLVLTDDIIMLVIFWEITSILSYLLIGHYFNRAASRRAALQSLLTTTLGGLVMFVGAVILAVQVGSNSISAILSDPPSGALTNIALVCLLIGAFSKSAIFPFHYWLPGAMAAPTPVSAYLHAAAMVKAGIYLLARFAPTFAEAEPWRPLVVSLGVFTMLLGGFQALREVDLKRLLAYGTVSQLGFITVVIGFGTRDTALAGLTLLLAHSLFKAALFLVVGIIDRQLSTRDIGDLSGVGRQAPTLAVISVVSVASMAGLPPLLGFVAKETALTAMLDEALAGSVWGCVALGGIVLGSALTAAYGLRFVWGAFWTKRDADGSVRARTPWPDPPLDFVASPLLLAVLTAACGIAVPVLDPMLGAYADSAQGGHGIHLALWHGLEPALALSAASLAVGVGVFWASRRLERYRRWRLLPLPASDVYYLVTREIDRLAVMVTRAIQRGSLPTYVALSFVVLVAAEAAVLVVHGDWTMLLEPWHHPAQPVAAVLMIAAGILAVRATKRFTGVVLVSVSGLGMVTLFALSGAPDLAITQVLIETVTLVVFTLVLRRIPARMGSHHGSSRPVIRALIGAAVGVTMAVVAVVASSARIAEPVSVAWEELAYEIGHGSNIVNVALVDLRGWDTMGELSVLVLAATGVTSLVFVTAREDRMTGVRRAMRKKTTFRQRLRLGRTPMVETTGGIRLQDDGNRGARRAWLLGGASMSAASRSLILEVVVRILFHTIIVISIYLLFAGHNLPGGGFAGGLVAGLALVMRYVAGGRYELGIAAPTDAGYMLGSGMVLAVGTAVAPMLFGLDPLTRAVWEAELPLVGHVEFVTSTVFDIGVYLVVVGLVLDVLRSLGGEVDRQIMDDGGRRFVPAAGDEAAAPTGAVSEPERGGSS
ncbi:Na+/H+ antiporter subunit A [Microbacterium sp. JB110]|uniref:Na+/H+ antiporter subunit A n=1 Tax=Microbacterium sp. JB110 TaxID=2024477 RepID=UPI00097E8F59|nr:Na+/H+ antiporter subunit A [Microbacterium sp. JB110]RCS60757.1 Na+/H+ antiporter subunit A [Microbacterium sp. JB110]SJM43821.1 Na(+) H(+) antiporter subunit A; Na(+) H(+) antiporter subunit B [Frigoribacterium sp. JB110]